MRYRQDATYWAAGVNNGLGTNTFPIPETIKVRWEEMDTLITDDKGDQKLSKAVVYCKEVLERGGYLALGILTDSNPQIVDAADRILSVSAIPNVRGKKVLRSVWL